MNVDTCKDCEEGMFGTISDHHVLKIVIIQNSGVHSFIRCSVLVNLFPFILNFQKYYSTY